MYAKKLSKGVLHMAISGVGSSVSTSLPAGWDYGDQVLAGLTGSGKSYAQMFPGSVDSFDAKSTPAPTPAAGGTTPAAGGTTTPAASGSGSTPDGGFLGDIEKLVSDGVGALEGMAGGLVSKLGDDVKNMADGLVSKIGDSAKSFADGLISKALQGLESIPLVGGLIKDFEPTIEKAADGLVGNLVDGLEKSADGLIGNVVGSLENSANGLVKDIGSGIEGWIDNGIKNIGGLLGGIFG
jgi:hypothetical protein